MMIDYKLIQSEYVVSNQKEFIQQSLEINNLFPNADMTASYYRYNIFCLTAGSMHFYHLFQQIREAVRSEIPNKPLWMQAWINLHTENNVLDWHDHLWPFHGYVSIDPKDTTTEFDNYTIENKAGQIYFGIGNRKHRVNVITPYQGFRITIGFDVTDDPIMNTGCLGFIPLI